MIKKINSEEPKLVKKELLIFTAIPLIHTSSTLFLCALLPPYTAQTQQNLYVMNKI